MVVLERKQVSYSYFAEPSYVFMDAEFNQYEVDKENMGDALNYLEEGMECEVVLYNDAPISVEEVSAADRLEAERAAVLRGMPAGLLAAELEGRGWHVVSPS